MRCGCWIRSAGQPTTPTAVPSARCHRRSFDAAALAFGRRHCDTNRLRFAAIEELVRRSMRLRRGSRPTCAATGCRGIADLTGAALDFALEGKLHLLKQSHEKLERLRSRGDRHRANP